MTADVVTLAPGFAVHFRPRHSRTALHQGSWIPQHPQWQMLESAAHAQCQFSGDVVILARASERV